MCQLLIQHISGPILRKWWLREYIFTVFKPPLLFDGSVVFCFLRDILWALRKLGALKISLGPTVNVELVLESTFRI